MKRYVIVLDFGYANDPSCMIISSISDLGDYAMQNYGQDPNAVILAQGYTYQYLQTIKSQTTKAEIMKIGIGQSKLTGLRGDGSYFVLQRARNMIIKMEKQQTGHCPPYPFSAILVAHHYHAPRAASQGEKLGMALTYGNGLPKRFYKVSAQWWCRSPLRWHIRECLGYLPLKMLGQI